MKSKKKYVGKKPSRKPYRRKLIYGAIIVAAVILGFLVYSSSQRPQNKPSNKFPFKAAIIDQLGKKTESSPPFYPNETFVNSLNSTLVAYGFEVDYYESEKVNVNFYRSLPTLGYGLTIFRVHSAIVEGLNLIGLFTSEPYVAGKYSYPGLLETWYNQSSSERYFGIAPEFIEASMGGYFENTIVVLMGCNGLSYNTAAEAFVNRGAQVCIGWNGLVSAPHTDQATEYLIRCLVVNKWTIKDAVNATMEEIGSELLYESQQGYKTVLKYYPSTAGNFTIPFAVSSFPHRIFGIAVIFMKDELKAGCMHACLSL